MEPVRLEFGTRLCHLQVKTLSKSVDLPASLSPHLKNGTGSNVKLAGFLKQLNVSMYVQDILPHGCSINGS